ncbi:MAG: hypothetical protein ACI4RC_07430 [Oscillospiraceae bacterium]
MNKIRREDLEIALHRLDTVIQDIDHALDDEQNCLDNIPENLQDSEKYEKNGISSR